MLKKKEFIVGAVAGLGVAFAAVAGVGLDWPKASAQSQPAHLVKAAAGPVFAPPPGAPMSFADIIDRVSPAVVSIETRSRVDANALRRIPGFENFPFELLPRGQGQGQGGGQGQEQEELPDQLGAGSGFFISADGYIVTNNHVVENAEEITVTLRDERELKATIVGRDEATDLAVLKVQGANFPFVQFNTQAQPRVGDWVIAVGNPFGLGGTATAGIISAYGRDIGEAYVDYLQIDAPINRGNSGGPTFDIYGRVIGVNTAIFTPTGVSAGIGFAIPSDVADRITRQLISGGKVERGYLGVTIGNVTEDIAESLNLQNRDGAYVTEITPGGPSAQAGLQVGDIVTRINGQPIKGSSDLTRRVGQARPGETLRLDVLRNGRTVQLNVRSGTRPSERELARQNGEDEEETPTPPKPVEPSGISVLDMTVTPLDAAARTRFGVGAGVNGVVITGVTPRSEAAKKGLRAGDVITRADNRPVGNVAELQSIIGGLRSANRPSVLLMINRDGRNAPVAIPLK
ncbi:MAG TPA: Do family serine endopeptidase [Caulobacteraceae bacterium]|nr:Do family serine endopeptidase [Caulobacteraceae bacterium]